MDWPTVYLILGGIAIIGVLVVGGTVTVKGLSVNTQGFLHWLRRASEEKGATAAAAQVPTSRQPINPKPRRLWRRLWVKVPRATIAWVDDKPLNNQFERLAFASAGIFCDSYTTNDDTLKALGRARYDLVISDIGRGGQAETGWDLLAEVKRQHSDMPFVFYTMGITDELRSKAQANGATGITETPDELARLVLDLISRRA